MRNHKYISMINLLLVDDRSNLNQRITTAFKHKDYNVNIVGSVTSGRDAIEQLSLFNVDVVLLDIIVPEMDGISCCQEIKELYPATKVITFIGELNPDLLLKIWAQKVDGILLKTCGTDELATTLTSIMKGNKIIDKNIPDFFDRSNTPKKLIPRLTKTEIEVLKLLGSGLLRKEVADRMNKSTYTVDFHCKNLLKKFNTNKMPVLLVEARKRRIIQ